MPPYRFLTRRPGTLDGDIVEADFATDEAAIEEARQALADSAHDAVLDRQQPVDEIEVMDQHGIVVATVSLKTPEL
jgi:hypothetical protein